MKKSLVLILAGTLCVMLAASGCTGTGPATTPSPAATTAALESPAITTTPVTPVQKTPSWTGT